MKITKSILPVLIIVLCVSAVAFGQARSQADVQVRSMTVTEAAGKLTLKFEVFSFHDDDALETTARVLLPVGVRFLSSATGCIPSTPVRDGTHSHATCNIGRLGVGASRTVQVVTTTPAIATLRKTFGAFAWSQTPDPLPANNYGEATAP